MEDISGSSEKRSDRRRIVLAVILVSVLVIVSLVGWLYARGGGPTPSWFPFASSGALDPSDSAEVVLRSVRLAGFERAVVGEEDGVAVVRLEIPAVSSGADVEVGWQVGVSSLAAGYPNSREYVVQLFEGDRSLIEVSWDGEKARADVAGGNAGALRADAEFIYLSQGQTGE